MKRYGLKDRTGDYKAGDYRAGGKADERGAIV